MSQPSPPGWTQYQSTLEKLLKATVEQSRVSALYLHGSPTSEFNTSLVDFIVQKAEAGLAPKRVLYITGTSLDMQIAASRPSVIHPMAANDYTRLLTIKAAKEFCDEYVKKEALTDRNLVLMIDVRMSATVAEEVMFGLVLDRLRQWVRLKRGGAQDVHVAVVLLGSTGYSQRTFDSFAKLMQVAKRAVQETQAPVERRLLSMEQLDEHVGRALKAGKRIVLGQDISWDLFKMLPEAFKFRDQHGNYLSTPMIPSGESASEDFRNLQHSQFIQVDPQSLFSASTNVHLVATSGNILSYVFDSRISQIVQAYRPLTRCEWDSVQSWAQLATPPARFVITAESPENIRQNDEVLGPAWSKDLMPLVLRTMETMGDDGNRSLRDFAMRVPANHVAWADRCRRLMILGCLEANTDQQSAYRLTPWGRSMSKFLWQHDFDWEVAWLIGSAVSSEGCDPVSRYVIMCMAAILSRGPRSFVSKVGSLKDDGGPYTSDDLRELCSPCLQHCVQYGMLWLYTGIYLKNRHSLFSSGTEANVTYLDDYIVMSQTTGIGIRDDVDRFLHMFRAQPPRNDNFDEIPLTQEQIDGINGVLKYAFLHRVAYFENIVRDPTLRGLPQDTCLAKDVVSLHDIRVDQDREFLDVEFHRAQGNRSTQAGGFYAMYHRLERYDDDDTTGPYYVATGLTWLPPEALRRLERDTGIPWPEMVLMCQN
ncbi:hypothetical protein F5Y01DRAFT_322566 [Xylaria sp. FL0043]|nr:hypothetical protein F5Y01DRAFT_322566 [Xylaria sp. FL0043]